MISGNCFDGRRSRFSGSVSGFAARACQALIIVLAMLVPSGFDASAEPPNAGKRIALLIANESYVDAEPTAHADNDAANLAAELKHDAFTVDLRRNVGKQAMQSAIDGVLGKITPKSAVLIYFKGIGIQAAHQTFLVPTDAEIWTEADVKREGVSLDMLMTEFNRRGASVKLAIIDAARTNPFERRFRSYSAGLAGLDSPEGSLVIFADAPNKVGKPQNGPDSLFMSELLKQVRTPNITAEEAFTRTRLRVSKASNGEDVPWMASSLVDAFSFASGTTASPPPPTPTPPPPSPQIVQKVAPPGPPPATLPTAPAAPERRSGPTIPSSPLIPATPPPKPTSSSAANVAGKAPGAVFSDCPDCPELVVVASGSFQMGSGTTPFDRPVHRVTIAKSFAIGRTEVTFDSWNSCADDGGCKHRPDTKGFGSGDRPVINVSWFDAKEYIAWLSKKVGKAYRLPSEAEWEYAAHGGTTTPFAWGDAVGTNLADCAECGRSGPRRTDPVKTHPPNGFGLYDMAGNAAEWVEDCWNMTYRNAPKDGSAWTTGSCETRGLRGGSFDSSSAYIKPTARFRYDADVRYWANGFRVARDLP